MDRRECEALGRSPKDALRNGLALSQECWTALRDGVPHAMMGVVSDGLLAGSGRVWFLGTDEVYRHGRDLLTYGPLFIEHWLEMFKRLHNIVIVENKDAILLLNRWGFDVGGDVEIYGGERFVPFSMARVAGVEPADFGFGGQATPTRSPAQRERGASPAM